MATLRASLRLTARADGFRGALRGAAGDGRRLGSALQGAAGRGTDSTRRTAREVGLLRSALGRTRDAGVRAMRGLNRATRGWRSSLQQLRGSLGNLRTDLGGVLGMLAGAGAAVGGFAREASFRTQLVRLGEESKRTPAEMEAYGHTLTAAGVRHGLSRREMLDMSTAAQAKGGVRLDGDLLDTAAQFHIRAGSQDGRQTGEALAIISRMPGDIAANIGGLLGALDAGLFSLSQVQSNLPALVGSFMPTGDIRQAGAFLNIAGLSRPTAPEAVSAAEQVMGDFRSLSKDIRTRFGVNVIDPATGDLRRDIVEAMIELAEKQPSMVELGDIFTREVVRTLGPLLSQERDADGLTVIDRARRDLARPLDPELLAESARTIQQNSPEFPIQSAATRLDGIVSSLTPLRTVGEAFRQFQTEILAGAGLVGAATIGTKIIRRFRTPSDITGGGSGRGGGSGLPGGGGRAQSMHVQTMTVGRLITGGRGPAGQTILGPDGRPVGGNDPAGQRQQRGDQTILGSDGRPVDDRADQRQQRGGSPRRGRELLRSAGRRLPLLATLMGGMSIASDLAQGDKGSAAKTAGGIAAATAGAKVGAAAGAPFGPAGAVVGSVGLGLVGFAAGQGAVDSLLDGPRTRRRSVRGEQRAAELASGQPSEERQGLAGTTALLPRRSVRGEQRAAELASGQPSEERQGLAGTTALLPRRSVRGEQRAAEVAGRTRPGVAEDIVLKAPIPSTPIVNHHHGNSTFNITIDGGPNRDNDLALAQKIGEEVKKILDRREERMRQLRRAVPVDRTKVRLH